jgi:hypothetical protein
MLQQAESASVRVAKRAAAMTLEKQTSDFWADWAKGKDLSPNVQTLMGYLALAEIAGTLQQKSAGTKFWRGDDPLGLDLDALHAAASAALSASRKCRRAARKETQMAGVR